MGLAEQCVPCETQPCLVSCLLVFPSPTSAKGPGRGQRWERGLFYWASVYFHTEIIWQKRMILGDCQHHSFCWIGFWRSFDCVAGKKGGGKGSWDLSGPEAAICSTSLLPSRASRKLYVIISIWKWILIQSSSASVFGFCMYLYIQAPQAWGQLSEF